VNAVLDAAAPRASAPAPRSTHDAAPHASAPIAALIGHLSARRTPHDLALALTARRCPVALAAAARRWLLTLAVVRWPVALAARRSPLAFAVPWMRPRRTRRRRWRRTP
jgi:hypothetical protein